MPSNIYPTMDSVGFLTNPRSKAERILTDYLGSNFSQSNVFLGKVKSLIYAIKNNTNNMPGTAKQIQDDLTVLYNAYLDSVTVDVQIVALPMADGSGESARYDLQISVQYLSNGVMESLGKSIQMDNTGFLRLVTLERL